MSVIKVDHLTKDYGNHRGVFDVSFEIEKGEVFGFLGPNGSGKTTTIRNILGFLKPDSGKTYIEGVEVWNNTHITNKDVGYIPGEINFPDKIKGVDLVKWLMEFNNCKNLSKMNMLVELLQLNNVDNLIKKMSKGMKQKLGIVCAFSHDPNILILDEPSSGLDPLMQDRFTNLLKNEKEKGKTVLLSSHIFSEVEKTCDRVAIIKQGEIVALFYMDEIRNPKNKVFLVKFNGIGESNKIIQEALTFDEISHATNTVSIRVANENIKQLLAILSAYEIEFISEIKLTLEDYFMKFYSVEGDK